MESIEELCSCSRDMISKSIDSLRAKYISYVMTGKKKEKQITSSKFGSVQACWLFLPKLILFPVSQGKTRKYFHFPLMRCLSQYTRFPQHFFRESWQFAGPQLYPQVEWHCDRKVLCKTFSKLVLERDDNC